MINTQQLIEESRRELAPSAQEVRH